MSDVISELDMHINEYMDGMPAPARDAIYTPAGAGFYRGLLNHLHGALYKPFKSDLKRFKRACNTSIDTTNINELYNSYELYKRIAFQFNKPLLLGDYSLLIGISTVTFNKWVNNESDINDINYNGVTYQHKEFIEYIKADIESSLISNVINNNSVGSMFMLKATYNYSESPKKVLIESAMPATPADVIAERARALLSDSAGKKS